MIKIYLDTCIWCRPFDEPSERVDEEANAFIKILKSAEKGKYQIIGSPQLELEASEIKDKSI